MTTASGQHPRDGGQLDVGAVVLQRFQSHLGTLEELSADSDLLIDLGLDSIGLVIILLDLADEFDLDLSSSRVTLADVNTLADVVQLIRALLEESAPNG